MKDKQVRWAELLETALTEPGAISEAYRAFHRFSFGNQVLAMSQCRVRGITMGPINTYKGWQGLGRQVRKGEKAIMLCMPVHAKRKSEDEQKDDEPREVLRFFIYRANWFVLSQTDGETEPVLDLPEWHARQAAETLGVKLGDFDHVDGNAQGFFRPSTKTVAINPLAQHSHRTMFHELAHAILHQENDTARDVEELEAECTAMLVADALGLEGLEEARGYVQNWHRDSTSIPEKSAKKILLAADKILKAGELAEMAQAA